MEQLYRDNEREYTNKIADDYNNKQGYLNIDHTDSNGMFHKGDGVDCQYCKNRGDVMIVETDNNNTPYAALRICDKCSTQRNNVYRLRKAGLERLSKKYTFDNYSADREWQKTLLSFAKDYIDNGFKDNKWLYIGGQSGIGKSHLCTAVTVELMKQSDALYIIWPTEARQIKAVAMDAEKYDEAVKKLQTVKLLYIDDFFKPVFNSNGFDVSTSKADVTLAYNILNYRYINELPTIISSELFSSEIERIDEAIAGRIAESCGNYMIDIARDKSRNYRTKRKTV